MPLMVTAVWPITFLGFWTLKGNMMSWTSSLHRSFPITTEFDLKNNNTVLSSPRSSGFWLFDVPPESPKTRNKKVSGTFPQLLFLHGIKQTMTDSSFEGRAVETLGELVVFLQW